MATDWKKFIKETQQQSAGSGSNEWKNFVAQEKTKANYNNTLKQIKDLTGLEADLETQQSSFERNWNDVQNTNQVYAKAIQYFSKMQSVSNELKRDASGYKKLMGDKAYNDLLKSFDEVLKNQDVDLKAIMERGKFYTTFKTADEYNTAVKNQGYAEKYKNRTYQQISDFIKSDDYNTMRRRGLIDESEAKWLRNQKYALGTSTQLQKELDSIEDLLKKAESIKKTKDSVTVSNMGNEFNPQKSIMPGKSDVAKANENFENQIKALGYKNVEQFNNDIENKKTTADILKTVIAQKKQIESFNQKWGGIKVEENYQPKINENETDSYYIAINQITPKALKSKTIKKHSKSALIYDRMVTNADYFAEMEPEEKNKYNKIYETKGITTANQYADDLISLALDKRLNKKVMQKNYDFTSKNIFNAAVGSIASVGESLGSGIEYVTNLLKGETDRRVLSATRAQGLREGTKSHWDSDVWDFVYDTTMSGIDSAAGMALSVAVPYLGEALLGGSAAAHTFNNALDRGVPQGDAVLSSLAAGVAESLFEHVSIGTVLKGGKITAGWTKKGLLQATKKTLVDMGVNFSEETLTEISNVITDRLINGELSNYDISVRDYYMQGLSPEDAKRKAAEDVGTQIGMAGLSGMLMGFGFGTIGSTYGLTKSQMLNSKAGSNVVKNGEVEALKTLAKDSGIAEIQKAAEKIDKNSKPSKIGYVFNSLLEEYSKNSIQQLTTALLENGATERGSNSAKGWATQILKNVVSPSNKEAIKQEIALRVNKLTGDVYANFVDNGKYGGDALLNLLEIGEDAPTGIGTQSEVKTGNTVINDQGVEVPVAADGEGAAVGPVMGDTVKGIAAAPRSGEIRTITEAYKQGVAENLEKQRPNPKTAKAEAETKGKTEEEIYFEEYFAKEKQITPEEEQILKDFAKANGLKVEFTDKAVDGKAYGRYADGTIVISRYAKKPMRALFKHEFSHSVENAKGYAKFQEYVLEKSNAFKQWLNLKGYGKWSELSDKITETYKKDKVKYDNAYAAAKADIVADFVGDVLFGEVVDAKGNPIKLDTNFLVELKKNDRNLFQRFVEWVHSILKRLTTKGVVNKDIVKLEQKFKRLVEQARQQRAKGEGEKSEGEYVLAREVNEATQKVGVEYDAETESVAPQYSLATWLDSDYVKDRNNAAQEISNAIGVSKKTAIKYINSINSIAKIIADDRVRLDYDAATGKTSFVSNVEYGGSIDFSTLCQKRKWLTGTFSAIQRELKNSALTASEVLKIRNMLKEKGIEVSCGLCYVEGSRAEMGVFAKQFIERYKKTNPQYTPDMVDVNTPEGVEALRVNHPEVYEAYEKFWNNKGVLNEGDSVLFASQRKPKLYSVRTDYKHEILDKFKSEDNVVEKNQNGGLRIQSFSDFEIVHLIDMMQVIMDMSRVGLAGQAYTKVPDFALALGDTGLKINLSLIAKGVDANGSLIFDDVEGMPIDTAMRLRNMYSKNVGTILVIFNDAQLKAALKDDRVDFIIPFHRSQWKRSQYAELGLPKDTKDYTYMQNERYIKPVYYTTRKGTQGKRKATNYMPIKDYWDFNKSGKENAESYLKLCAENNKRPKFYKLLVDNKDGSYSLQPDGSTDGYWKLLIDFKMYDNTGKGSPQTPVKPTFNMKESMRMLEEYKGDHASFPADQETVDAFVKEYKSKHKLDNFTESNRGKIEVKDDYDVGSYSLPDLDTEYMKAVESGDTENADIKYSLPEIDNEGNKLSEGQRRFFDKSKLTDEQGNLLRLYHGSRNGGFTKFSAKYSDDGITLFLTPSRELAGTYTDSMDTIKLPEGKKGLARMFETGTDKGKGQSGIYEVYANAKNPYILECNGEWWNRLPFTEKLKGKTIFDSENTLDPNTNTFKTKVTIDGKVYEKTFDLNHIVEKVKKVQENYSEGINKEVHFKYDFADLSTPEIFEYYRTFANETIAEELKRQANLSMYLRDGITKTFKTVYDNKTGDYTELNTRFVGKWAKEKGYDSVWFKNVRDTGAVSQTVAKDSINDVVIVFDSSQIKSVDNLEPTKNKDIRYSLPDDGIPKIARGKSYKELDALVKEGKITSDEAFKALGEENGTMPKGENPKVDVNVPEKVSKTKNVNQFMRNVLESGHLDANMTEREKRNIISGARTYNPISDKAALDKAEKKIKADVNGAVQEWENAINGNRRITKYEIALGEQLLVQAAETGNANDVTRYVAELAELGTQLGQDIQALRLLKKMTGMGQLYYVTRAVARLNKDIESRYGEKHKIVEIDPNLANILANAKSEAEIDDVVKDLIKDVASQVESSWVDKFNSWRYLAMLGNPRTHFRNIVGNAVFMPAVGTKNKIAAIMETMFVDKENRTKTFGFLKPEYKDFATEDFKKVEEIIKGGGKMNPADQIRDQMKVYNSKAFAWLEGVRQFNFNALETEDGWFLKGHYIRALGGAMQARGLDVNNIKPAQLEELRTYAIKEAQKATYRDASHFAQTLNKLAHPGKDANLLSKAAGVAVEGLLPFKKTPINILKRGIEYSPIGIATSIADAVIAAKKGQYSGTQFIDGLSSGLTGTGIMLLGAFFWSIGWISGGMDYDDEDALERLAGKQPYALKVGDYTFTIDFAAPAVLPFMVGAETAKILNGKGNDDAIGFFDAIAAMGAPMTELSMLQGLNDAIETIAYSDNKMGDFATNIFASYFSQYVPTIGGQIARTFDSTRRTNFVDKNSPFPKIIQTTYQKALGKIPGAENTKVPYIDAWGRTEENDNFLLRAFENFVSPGYISKVTDDSVNNELAKIYTDTGESGVIPKRASTSFEVSGERVNLNADEYVQYATDKGQYSRKYLEEIMSSDLYNGLSSDGKAEAIAFLFSYANAKAKSNVSDYDYREVSTYKTAAKLEDAGISPASYAVAKFAMSKENADTDGSGSVTKSEKQKALRDAGFSSRDANKILNINKK